MTLKGDVEFDSAGYPHKVTSPSPEKVTEPITTAADTKGYYEELVRQRGLRAAFDIAVDDVLKARSVCPTCGHVHLGADVCDFHSCGCTCTHVELAREPAPVAISFTEGKKIYDQGWNDGIEHLEKVLKIAVEARFRNR